MIFLHIKFTTWNVDYMFFLQVNQFLRTTLIEFFFGFCHFLGTHYRAEIFCFSSRGNFAFFDAIVWAEINWIFDVNFRTAFWTQKRKKSNNFLVKIPLRNINFCFFLVSKTNSKDNPLTFFFTFLWLFFFKNLLKVSICWQKNHLKKHEKWFFGVQIQTLRSKIDS